MWNAHTRATSWRLIKCIGKDFFWVQWKIRLGKSHPKIIHLDHPEDNQVPFKPEWFPIYLGFISEVYSTLCYFPTIFKTKWHENFIDYISGLHHLYIEAGKFYLHYPSTMKRKFSPKNFHSWIIYLTDPHYACFPSLHITIMCYNFLKVKALIRNYLNYPEKPVNQITTKLPIHQELLLNHNAKQAILIGMSVLLVKQHSINCIVGALIFLEHEYPEWTTKMSQEYLLDISQIPELGFKKQQALHQSLAKIYRKIKVAESDAHSTTEVLVQFLLDYQSLRFPPNKPALQR